MKTLERFATYGAIAGFLLMSSGCVIAPGHERDRDGDRGQERDRGDQHNCDRDHDEHCHDHDH